MAVDWGEGTPRLVDEEQRRHTHLRLAAALDPQPRRTRQGGGRGHVRYSNRDQHGQQIRRQLSSIRESHKTRTAIFVISPELVMVVEFNREMSAPDESVEQAGLRFLAARERHAIAAFASDSDLVEFLRHLELYREGVPPNRRSAHYEDLFDAIENIRPLAPSDVLDTAVQRRVSELSEDDTIRVDVQCWCPDDEPEARRRFDDTIHAIEVAHGIVVDKSFRWQSGLSLIRADVSAGAIWRLADIDRVRQISLLPQPRLTVPQVAMADFRGLPQVEPPDDGTPIVAVIDSGVRAGHPLLAPAMYAAVRAGTQLRDGSDEHGHGTLVASLALYGSLESLLSSREPVKAAGRLLSIRVLDNDGYFPEEDLWDKQLAAAIELAARHGAKVVNLSLGDSTHPYIPPSPDPIAAMVDELAKKYRLIIVISTGNFGEVEYLRDADTLTSHTPTQLGFSNTRGRVCYRQPWRHWH